MMKQLDFYYDPVSPYAYLAFQALPEALSGVSYHVRYRPAFLGGILKHWGQLAPAEIVPKREWTLRQMFWQAKERGIAMDMPNAHPFNSLPLLRMALAASKEIDGAACTNRYQTQLLLEHVWLGGLDPLDTARLAALAEQLGLSQASLEAEAENLKQALRSQTEAAIAQGVFGMPAFVVEETLFWGLDSLPMLRTFLEGKEVLPKEIWNLAKTTPNPIPSRRTETR